MEIVELSANIRTRKRKGIKALRREGLLPAVVYGALPEPLAVQLDTHSTTQILRRLHGTTLIDLKVAGRTHKSLVREVQRDVIRGHLMHIDFLADCEDIRHGHGGTSSIFGSNVSVNLEFLDDLAIFDACFCKVSSHWLGHTR